MTQTQNNKTNCPQFKVLRSAGVSIIIMAVLAGVSMGLFFGEGMELRGAALSAFYSAHLAEYRWAVVSWVLILLCDLAATVCFLEAFRNERPLLGRATAQLRFVYSVFLLFGIIKLFRILGGIATVADIEQAVYGFRTLWYAGLIVFGLHLMGLGLLMPKNTKLQLAIRWSLLIGGVGYILLHGGEFMVTNFAPVKSVLEPALVVPMILGELGLAIYLTVSPKRLTGSFAHTVANPA